VKCKFLFYKKIDIYKLKSISKAKKLVSITALSFDRIEIKFCNFYEIALSPKNKIYFAGGLLSINKSIESKLAESQIDNKF
jgi:hypothetical protein